MARIPAALRARTGRSSTRPHPHAVHERGPLRVSAGLQRPFVVGLVGTIGAIAALVLAVVVGSLATILTYVFMALFLALGLDPTVRWLQRRRFSRPLAVTLVFVLIVLLAAAAAVFLVPPLVHQLVQFVRVTPTSLHEVQDQDWFRALNGTLGDTVDLDAVGAWLKDAANDPQLWAAVSGGVLQFGVSFLNGAVGVVTVLILTIFFLASLPSMKNALYSLIPIRRRGGFAEITDEIVDSVGGYVGGMVILAAVNAGLGLVAMLIFGVPFAGLLAVLVFFVTLIPLIGSILATVMVVIVALFNSPATAIEIGVYYLVYMQVEAYVLTPRIMNKTVAVPGSLVVIGALAGGTLLGMVGALVAIPVTAAILIIINKVVVPYQAVPH